MIDNHDKKEINYQKRIKGKRGKKKRKKDTTRKICTERKSSSKSNMINYICIKKQVTGGVKIDVLYAKV